MPAVRGVSLYPPRPIPKPVSGDERLGPYRLCLELALGGQATVYLARAENKAGMRRFVAIKRLHPHLANDPEFRALFLDEARIASLVQHANLCNLLDFDASPAGHYLVMDYLAGESLAQVFRAMQYQRATSPERRAVLVARVIADASEGLHAAHEACDVSGYPLAVVHRDVSPDNVFVTYDGVVKVCDFGVARAAQQLHKTRTGVLMGKYAYMAPEVLDGSAPDRRADIWSVGVVLWEMLTLKRLFSRASDIETLQSLSGARIPAPSQACPGLPSYLDDIVLRALSLDWQARYQTARELGRALLLALAEQREAPGLADLSDWMDELFPSGRACKQQLLQIAAHCDEPSGGARTTSARVAEAGATSEPADSELTVVRLADGEPTIVRVDERTLVRIADGEATVVRVADGEPTRVRVTDARAVPAAAGGAGLPGPDGELQLRRRPRPLRTALVVMAVLLGSAGISVMIWRPPQTWFASSTPNTISTVLPAPSPTAATKPEMPAPSASVPYSVELAPQRGVQSSDIVIRIRPGGIENAAPTQRAAPPKAAQRKVAKKSPVWPPTPKAKLKALEPARLQAGAIR
jgi:serine/threonine protein kinase